MRRADWYILGGRPVRGGLLLLGLALVAYQDARRRYIRRAVTSKLGDARKLIGW